MKSGLPSRETWRNGPLLTFSPFQSSHSVTCCRLAVVHTPITEAESDTPCLPGRSSSEVGICIAIECTLRWAVALTPAAGLEKTCMPYWACSSSNGRRLARSKIEPRST